MHPLLHHTRTFPFHCRPRFLHFSNGDPLILFLFVFDEKPLNAIEIQELSLRLHFVTLCIIDNVSPFKIQPFHPSCPKDMQFHLHYNAWNRTLQQCSTAISDETSVICTIVVCLHQFCRSHYNFENISTIPFVFSNRTAIIDVAHHIPVKFRCFFNWTVFKYWY